ncbi:hypothetical protein GCM10009760_07700 [Kitasatospora kazusensis]|uniref:Uncharacterized protein n=1 Tax=Kitasatospora kazusensis TaxID=407974 RepID=A0ABP5KHQ6_9ACTN
MPVPRLGRRPAPGCGEHPGHLSGGQLGQRQLLAQVQAEASQRLSVRADRLGAQALALLVLQEGPGCLPERAALRAAGGELVRPAPEEGPLGGIPGERGGPEELQPGFRGPVQPEQQVVADARQEVVVPQRGVGQRPFRRRDPPGDGRLVGQERPRGLFGRQPAEQAQRHGDPGLGRQHGVTGDQHQPQHVVLLGGRRGALPGIVA